MGEIVRIWFKAPVVAVVVFSALTLGIGCGGGGSSASTGSVNEEGSASVGKAAFVKQADAVCLQKREKTLARVGPYEKKHEGEGLSEAALVRNAIKAAVLVTLEQEIAALAKLQAPAEDAEEFEAIIADLRSALDEAREANTKTSKEVENIFLPVDKELRAYGLTGCTKNS
jgi:hypothetical protein